MQNSEELDSSCFNPESTTSILCTLHFVPHQGYDIPEHSQTWEAVHTGISYLIFLEDTEQCFIMNGDLSKASIVNWWYVSLD